MKEKEDNKKTMSFSLSDKAIRTFKAIHKHEQETTNRSLSASYVQEGLIIDKANELGIKVKSILLVGLTAMSCLGAGAYYQVNSNTYNNNARTDFDQNTGRLKVDTPSMSGALRDNNYSHSGTVYDYDTNAYKEVRVNQLGEVEIYE